MDKNLQTTLIYMEELRKSIDGIADSSKQRSNVNNPSVQDLQSHVNHLQGTLHSVSSNIQQYLGQYGIYGGYNVEINAGGLDDLINAVAQNPVDVNQTVRPNNQGSATPQWQALMDRQNPNLGLPNVFHFAPMQDDYVSPVVSILQEEIYDQQRFYRGHEEPEYYSRPNSDQSYPMKSISDVLDLDHDGGLHTHGASKWGLNLSRR